MTSESIAAVDGSGAIFESPDLQCGRTWSGARPDEESYEAAVRGYDGECSSGAGYACGTAISAGASEMRRCHAGSGYSVESVTHVADSGQDQVFGVLMENSGGLRGFPPVSGSLYYDANGDGAAERDVRGVDLPATDPDGQRHAALHSIATTWKHVRESAASEERSTEFGLWTFSGDPHPTNLVDETHGEGAWTGAEEPARVDEVLNALESPEFQPEGRGNVLESVSSLLDPDDNEGSPYAGGAHQGLDKTLVVFADGPPALPPGWRPGATAEQVIAAAEEANVRIYFVHLDPRIAGNSGENAAAEQILDDYQYYSQAAQSDNCTGDADCASHETCREVRGYSERSDGDVGEGGGEYREGRFCMPQRRADGRTGPLEIYSEIACATGGGYQYVKSVDALSEAMGWLPLAMDGLWEVDVAVEGLADEEISPTAGPVWLQGSFEVATDEGSGTLEFSQNDGDDRSVLFSGGP